eukprot:scaffold59740_cov18-Tisochrysis_lutea.AAC.1
MTTCSLLEIGSFFDIAAKGLAFWKAYGRCLLASTFVTLGAVDHQCIPFINEHATHPCVQSLGVMPLKRSANKICMFTPSMKWTCYKFVQSLHASEAVGHKGLPIHAIYGMNHKCMPFITLIRRA